MVADILVLRCRSGGAEPADQAWTETAELREVRPELAWGFDDRISQWFITNPDLVLGELQADQNAGYGRTVRVEWPDDAEPVEQALAVAAGRIVAAAKACGRWWDPPAAVPVAGDLGIQPRADGRKELSFHLVDGAVMQVQEGLLLPVAVRGNQLAELAALIRLRDAAVGLLDAETHYDRGEADLAPPG